MYCLSVYHPKEQHPTKTLSAESAPEVFDQISRLLADYHDCERVTVGVGPKHLFSVDREGNTMTGTGREP